MKKIKNRSSLQNLLITSLLVIICTISVTDEAKAGGIDLVIIPGFTEINLKFGTPNYRKKICNYNQSCYSTKGRRATACIKCGGHGFAKCKHNGCRGPKPCTAVKAAKGFRNRTYVRQTVNIYHY